MSPGGLITLKKPIGRLRKQASFFDGPSAREKRLADRIKDLQICGAGGKSRKRPTLFAGKKSNGKYQLCGAIIGSAKE
jgi:hypothetical protein